MLNQKRSTPVRCFTRPAGVSVEGGTGAANACSSVRPATLFTTVARRKSSSPVSVSPSVPLSGGRVRGRGATPSIPMAGKHRGQTRRVHLRGIAGRWRYRTLTRCSTFPVAPSVRDVNRPRVLVALAMMVAGALLTLDGPSGVARAARLLVEHGGIVLIALAVAALLAAIAPRGTVAGPVIVGLIGVGLVGARAGLWSGEALWT